MWGHFKYDPEARLTRRARSPLLPLHLDGSAAMPLHRQLYAELRAIILAGRLPPGARLPASRGLASELGISRNTVTAAFEQLAGEGYVEGRHGSGSFVSRELPDRAAGGRAAPPGETRRHPAPAIADRGRLLAGSSTPRAARPVAVSPGPDCSDFPFDLWARLLARAWRRPPPDLYAAGDPAGHLPLREAIAEYLRAVRAVRCEAAQVIIVSGAGQAVDLAARVLLDPGDAVWMEEPGYAGIRAALMASGAKVMPVPVDAEGIDVASGEHFAPRARLACVSPSHQYPLGIVMSLARRLDLLAWARRADAWVLEDDYDSEFRYAGRPLAALQGLDEDGRVVYVGSFSKVLFPSLRLGYLVVPAALAQTFARARAAIDDHPASAAQPALAEFIGAGHFAAHVRRMRRRYAGRQEALLAAAGRHLEGLLDLSPDPAGMHLVAGFAPALARRMSDRQASQRIAAAGLAAPPLSSYFAGRPTRHGLLLGYAAVPEAEMDPAVAQLAAALARG